MIKAGVAKSGFGAIDIARAGLQEGFETAL
jgi:hypothetical protein